MITKEIKLRVGDVYLAQFGTDTKLLTIKDISGGYIKHDYRWESAEDFLQRSLSRYGRRKKYLFFFSKIVRD